MQNEKRERVIEEIKSKRAMVEQCLEQFLQNTVDDLRAGGVSQDRIRSALMTVAVINNSAPDIGRSLNLLKRALVRAYGPKRTQQLLHEVIAADVAQKKFQPTAVDIDDRTRST